MHAQIAQELEGLKQMREELGAVLERGRHMHLPEDKRPHPLYAHLFDDEGNLK